MDKRLTFMKKVVIAVGMLCAFSGQVAASEKEVFDLELSELMTIQITSAGRKEQLLSEVPAAVTVISQEDIRQSGVTSIPEALRMVPGLQVARISSSKWAIASRGFNGTFSNKLLVQIDGRSLYSPTYSGVYWDVQTVPLEDVERIEVIRGPGATLWGANAVNGIINIITKAASDTQGILFNAGGGNHEKALATLRYGTQWSEDLYSKFYVQYNERDAFRYHADGTDASDDWEMLKGGFRLDGDLGLKDTWTLQGDFFSGDERQQISPFWTESAVFPTVADDGIEAEGYNLLARLQHRISDKHNWTLQTYFDHGERDEIYLGQTHSTFDVDFQHRLPLGNHHDVIWGLGYRRVEDRFRQTYMVSLHPSEDETDLLSGFVQDEIRLLDDSLWLTLGGKVERNDYTGTEVQPSARVLWKPMHNHSFWTSVSKAVRIPSRVEKTGEVVTQKFPLPPTFTTAHTLYIYGNSSMKAEEVVAYEAGYRFSYDKNLSLDISLFYNDYNLLTSYDFSFLPTGLPERIVFGNDMYGTSRGFESSLVWEPFDWLSSELNYSYVTLKMSLKDAEDTFSIMDIVAEESSPEHQVSLRTSLSLRDNLHLNLWGRYVDELKTASPVAYTNGMVVPDYFALDANIVWQIRPDLELLIAGQNLTDSAHLEFINEYFTPAIDVERSVYTKLTWTY